MKIWMYMKLKKQMYQQKVFSLSLRSSGSEFIVLNTMSKKALQFRFLFPTSQLLNSGLNSLQLTNLFSAQVNDFMWSYLFTDWMLEKVCDLIIILLFTDCAVCAIWLDHEESTVSWWLGNWPALSDISDTWYVNSSIQKIATNLHSIN